MAKKAESDPWNSVKRQFDDREAHYKSVIRGLMIIAFIGLSLGIMGLGGVFYYSNQSIYIPYIIQVDKLGNAASVGIPERASYVDDRIVKAYLSQFIADVRLVTPDAALQRLAIFRVYGLLNDADPATGKVTEYLNKDPKETPFARAQRETVHAEILTILPQTESTYEVDWIETRHARNGLELDRYKMRAIVSFYLVPPGQGQTEESLKLNPVSLYIRDFSWTRIKE
jgi:Type IV secretory pathway, TrbF components